MKGNDGWQEVRDAIGFLAWFCVAVAILSIATWMGWLP
jgi:hypothetical protein